MSSLTADYALQMNRYFLIPIGAWALGEEAPMILKLLRSLNVLLCYFLICFLLVPCGLHTFLEQTNPAIKLKLIGPMSFCLMAISKYCSFVNKSNEIRESLRHLQDDWQLYSEKRHYVEEELLKVMQRNAKLGRFLTLMCAAFMYGGGFFYHTIMPLSSGRIATTEHNEDILDELFVDSNASEILDLAEVHGGGGPVRALTYPIYRKLFNVDNFKAYVVVFGIQFMSGFVLYTITIGACSLAASCVVHVCGQLEIVMRMLQEFARASSKVTMSEIIQRHLRALDFARRVEENLNFICFVEFIGCTMNICFLEYYFITEWTSRNTISTMTYCILLISFTFNIFIFCYIGELLTEQCRRVGEVTYSIDWHTLPAKKGRDLVLIMAIANAYPAKITAGKMVNLSLSSFCNVLKTSATYLNLLRTVML